jgi:tetratricopeptide (TPR) repeat protein
MKLKRLLLAALILPVTAYSQEFKRKVFDYEKLTKEYVTCNDDILKALEEAMLAVEEYNSAKAVKLSKVSFDKNNNCPDVYLTYGYSLFRSGEWLDGLDIVEKGIEKFGSVPELVKLRSDMSLEMYELGIGQKNIDGNSVYKANDSRLKYNEDQFKEANLRSALTDLIYLNNRENNPEDTYTIAIIYRELGEYDSSNKIFESLTTDVKFGAPATFHIAGNLISLKKYDEAERKLLKMLETYKQVPDIYERLAEIYELKGEKNKQEDYKKMAVFYKYVPDFTDLTYSSNNYDLLMFFGGDAPSQEKLKKLEEIQKANDINFTIDICIVILNIHSNHGNGVEEKATAILTGIGTPSLNKVHKLFQSDVSTCTITNLATIMAAIKDERSWEILIDYLPRIASMPSTLIPPNVPEKVILFDEERGTREVLRVVKTILNKDPEESQDIMGSLGFGTYVFYAPLKEIKKDKVLKIARELNYTDSDIVKLQEELKD